MAGIEKGGNGWEEAGGVVTVSTKWTSELYDFFSHSFSECSLSNNQRCHYYTGSYPNDENFGNWNATIKTRVS